MKVFKNQHIYSFQLLILPLNLNPHFFKLDLTFLEPSKDIIGRVFVSLNSVLFINFHLLQDGESNIHGPSTSHLPDISSLEFVGQGDKSSS